jgi:hypothetical protein
MRCLIARIAAVLLLGPAVGVVAAETASAAGCGPGTVPTAHPLQGTICVPAASPGSDDGSSSGGTSLTSSTQGSQGRKTCEWAGKTIPCSRGGSSWFAAQGCYASQGAAPPKDNPAWAGHTDGSVWTCYGNGPDGVGQGYDFWVAPGAAAPAPVLVDPGVLAERALNQLQLARPSIRMAPQPPLQTYVGLETWLWMDPAQWRALDLTVTAGPTAVTVTAEPVRAVWDLTEGSTTCGSAGRAWVEGMGDEEQTDCSYTFTQISAGETSDAFPVTSTLMYQVDWTCAGGCLEDAGTLGEVSGLPGAAGIRVGERQSVVVRSGES